MNVHKFLFNVFILLFFLKKSLLSYEVNLEFPNKAEINKKVPVFSFKQIQNLINPIAVQYIYFLDWEDYRDTKRILKKGILFTYRNLMVDTVYIAGNFSNWKKIQMKRNQYGIFYWIQPIVYKEDKMITDYYYKYNVNGIWILDPVNDNKRLLGTTEYSYFYFEDPESHYLDSIVILKKEKFQDDKYFYLVEFRIHEDQLKRVLNKNQINTVSIISNFNYWNSDINVLIKDEKGVYRFKTYLYSGVYYYNFVVDGEWVLDPLNQNTKYLENFKKLFNYIELP